MLKRLLFALFVVFLAYRIYQEPIPDGTKEPIKLKAIFTVMRGIMNMGNLCETLGISTTVNVRRLLLDKGAGIVARTQSGVQTKDTEFDGIRVRLYYPDGVAENAPGVVYYHGGGWCIGSIESHNVVTSYMAKQLSAVVVSVEYRLGPEHRHWEAMEDCVRATKYFLSNAAQFGVNPHNIAISGDSAGGNLAAGVALSLRDAGDSEGFQPQPALQVLIYPSVQSLDMELPSYQQNSHGPFLGRDQISWFKSNIVVGDSSLYYNFMNHTYVPQEIREKMARGRLNHDLIAKEQKYPPYKPPKFEGVDLSVWARVKDTLLSPSYSPLLAESHVGLPETYILTCQFDPLRDDGHLYAHRLRESGVPVTLYNEKVGWHGMINFINLVRESRAVLDTTIDFMKSRMH